MNTIKNKSARAQAGGPSSAGQRWLAGAVGRVSAWRGAGAGAASATGGDGLMSAIGGGGATSATGGGGATSAKVKVNR